MNATPHAEPFAAPTCGRSVKRHRVLSSAAGGRVSFNEVFAANEVVATLKSCARCANAYTRFCPHCDEHLCAGHSPKGKCLRCDAVVWVTVWLSRHGNEQSIVGYEFAIAHFIGWRAHVTSSRSLVAFAPKAATYSRPPRLANPG